MRETYAEIGYIPNNAEFFRIRISLKEVQGEFQVTATAYKGGKPIATEVVFSSFCKSCAKGFAMRILRQEPQSEHDAEFSERDWFEAQVAILRAVIGGSGKWRELTEGAQHRLMWLARLIADGQLSIEEVLKVWQVVEPRHYSTSAAVSDLFASIQKLKGGM